MKNKKQKRPKHRRSIRSGRGALWILALIFMSSAGIRIFSGTGAAIARELTAEKMPDVITTTPLNCTSDEDNSALISALLRRESEVQEQELLLAQKWKAVEIAHVEIKQNLTILEDAEIRLSATMARAQTAAEDDLAKLTAVYEAMKPKEAAALFEAMSPDFAAGFLGRMRSDTAAAVLAGLEPETAYTISVILAGRNANVPSE